MSYGVRSLDLSNLRYSLSQQAQTRSAWGSALQNMMVASWLQRQAPPKPIDGFGGAKDRTAYWLTGVGNQSNEWGAPPYVIGEDVKYFPPIGADPYSYLIGQKQYCVGVLLCGYGKLNLGSFKVGDVSGGELSEFGTNFLPGASPTESLVNYSQDNRQVVVSKDLKANVEQIQQCPQAGEQISFMLEFPSGLQRNKAITQGGVVTYVPEARSVTFNVHYRQIGSPTWILWNGSVQTVTANSPFHFRQTFTLTVPRGRYEVRIMRTTADATTPDIIDESSWATLRAISYVTPFRPKYTEKGNRKLFSLFEFTGAANQQTNGVLGQIRLTVSREVPVWNGTAWISTATSNPAWYWVDVLTGLAFNEYVSKDEIDLPAIVAWANFCTAKGFKMKYVIDSHMEIEEVLDMICRCGRAKWFQKDGKYTVVYDDERATQVQHFTDANSREYIGNRSYEVIPTALAVRFLNEKNDFLSDLRIVYADGYGEASTTNVFEQVDFPGVTDPALIYKHARYELAVMRLRPETHQLVTNMQHFACNIGDKVKLCHGAALIGLGSGMISQVITNGGGDVTGFVLSQLVTMEAGKSYDVEIRLADGTFLTKTLTTIAGETDTLTFATPVLAATAVKPAKGDSVAFGLTGAVGLDCIITGIEHLENWEARLTMVPYSPAIFASDTGSIPPFDPMVSKPHEANWILPVPQWRSIRSDDTVMLRRADGSLESRIAIAMEPPTDLRITHYQFDYKRATDPSGWVSGIPVRVGDGDQVVVGNVEDGQSYDIRIRHYAEPGKASLWTVIPTQTVIGQLALPPNVISISRVPNSNKLRPNYDYLPLDFKGFRWKYALGPTRNWETAQVLSIFEGSSEVDISVLPKTIVSIGVVMVDLAGNESEVPAWTVIEVDNIIEDNIILTNNFHPTFPGTKTNCHVSGGKLFADDNGALMWNQNANIPMWATDGSVEMWTALYKDAVYEFEFTPEFSYAEKSFRLLMRYGQELKLEAPQGYILEFRRLGSAFMWDQDEDVPMWSADGNDPMWPNAEDPWMPWPGAIQGSSSTVQMRLTMYGGSREPRVDECAFAIDVPDILESLNDIEILPGGTRLPIEGNFTVIKHCVIALQYSGAYPTAERWIVQDKDAISGPLIEVFDSNGVSVGGIVDATLRGY